MFPSRQRCSAHHCQTRGRSLHRPFSRALGRPPEFARRGCRRLRQRQQRQATARGTRSTGGAPKVRGRPKLVGIPLCLYSSWGRVSFVSTHVRSWCVWAARARQVCPQQPSALQTLRVVRCANVSLSCWTSLHLRVRRASSRAWQVCFRTRSLLDTLKFMGKRSSENIIGSVPGNPLSRKRELRGYIFSPNVWLSRLAQFLRRCVRS